MENLKEQKEKAEREQKKILDKLLIEKANFINW